MWLNKKILVVLSILFLTPACSRHRRELNSFREASTVIKNDALVDVSLSSLDVVGSVCNQLLCDQESFLNNVFIPLYTRRWLVGQAHVFLPENDIALGYEVPFSIDDLVALYIDQMDCFGWRLIKIFTTSVKSTLIFEVPQQICVIDLSALDQDHTTLIIFMGKKHKIRS